MLWFICVIDEHHRGFKVWYVATTCDSMAIFHDFSGPQNCPRKLMSTIIYENHLNPNKIVKSQSLIHKTIFLLFLKIHWLKIKNCDWISIEHSIFWPLSSGHQIKRSFQIRFSVLILPFCNNTVEITTFLLMKPISKIYIIKLYQTIIL